MSTTRLPELPSARIRRHTTNCAIFDLNPGRCDCESPPKTYDADVHAYGLAVWKEAMEEAERVARIHAMLPGELVNDFNAGYADAANIIADTLAGLPLPEQGRQK